MSEARASLLMHPNSQSFLPSTLIIPHPYTMPARRRSRRSPAAASADSSMGAELDPDIAKKAEAWLDSFSDLQPSQAESVAQVPPPSIDNPTTMGTLSQLESILSMDKHSDARRSRATQRTVSTRTQTVREDRSKSRQSQTTQHGVSTRTQTSSNDRSKSRQSRATQHTVVAHSSSDDSSDSSPQPLDRHALPPSQFLTPRRNPPRTVSMSSLERLQYTLAAVTIEAPHLHGMDNIPEESSSSSDSYRQSEVPVDRSQNEDTVHQGVADDFEAEPARHIVPDRARMSCQATLSSLCLLMVLFPAQ